MPKSYYVYILRNDRGTLYIGVTNDLIRRIWEHKQKLVPGFTFRYQIDTLIYFESFERIVDAISREKRLKRWNRDWKMRLIRKLNPALKDLYNEIIG